MQPRLSVMSVPPPVTLGPRGHLHTRWKARCGVTLDPRRWVPARLFSWRTRDSRCCLGCNWTACPGQPTTESDARPWTMSGAFGVLESSVRAIGWSWDASRSPFACCRSRAAPRRRGEVAPYVSPVAGKCDRSRRSSRGLRCLGSRKSHRARQPQPGSRAVPMSSARPFQVINEGLTSVFHLATTFSLMPSVTWRRRVRHTAAKRPWLRPHHKGPWSRQRA